MGCDPENCVNNDKHCLVKPEVDVYLEDYCNKIMPKPDIADSCYSQFLGKNIKSGEYPHTTVKILTKIKEKPILDD